MSGHKPFKTLSDQLQSTPEARARTERERQFVDAIVTLTRLQEARGATQQRMADAWAVSQANISQIEHTKDISLSTLRKYVEVLGGRLEISAVFPDQIITLTPDVQLRNSTTRDEPDTRHAALTGS